MSKVCIKILVLAVLGAISLPVRADHDITISQLEDKAKGMWLGQLIGNRAGRPTEGGYSGINPNSASSVPWDIVQSWDSDDDTDLEYLAMHILQEWGFDCSLEQIVQEWIEHTTSYGLYIANRQA